jgi:hypothetical protein
LQSHGPDKTGHSGARLPSATSTLPAMTSGMPFTYSRTLSRIQFAAISFEASARNLRLPALAMLPLVAPVTASATTWYVLNYGTGQCENSEAIARRSGIAAFASPGALEAALKGD